MHNRAWCKDYFCDLGATPLWQNRDWAAVCIPWCHSEHVQMWLFVPSAALCVTGAVSETAVPCSCCSEDEWTYPYLAKYPYITSPAFLPWRVSVTMAFSKALSILWKHFFPLPLVSASSTRQLWCPSVHYNYNCMEKATIAYVYSCLLFFAVNWLLFFRNMVQTHSLPCIQASLEVKEIVMGAAVFLKDTCSLLAVLN